MESQEEKGGGGEEVECQETSLLFVRDTSEAEESLPGIRGNGKTAVYDDVSNRPLCTVEVSILSLRCYSFRINRYRTTLACLRSDSSSSPTATLASPSLASDGFTRSTDAS
jgi:hypothetical protein